MVMSAAEEAEAALDSYQWLAGRLLQWHLGRKGQEATTEHFKMVLFLQITLVPVYTWIQKFPYTEWKKYIHIFSHCLRKNSLLLFRDLFAHFAPQ